MPLLALGGGDPGGEGRELLEGLHAEPAEPLHHPVEHVHGGAGVLEGTVVGRDGGAEGLGQRGELAVRGVVAGDHPAREARGVEHLELRPRPALLFGEVLEEADVERRVVGHQDASARELQERRQRGVDRRRCRDHGVGDAGEHGDEGRDLGARVDQRLELAEHLAAADLHRADLGDHRPALGRAAGGLEVDDTERDVAQRAAQLVESALRLPPGGRTLDRSGGTAGHVVDARSGHRQTPGRRAGYARRHPGREEAAE